MQYIYNTYYFNQIPPVTLAWKYWEYSECKATSDILNNRTLFP